MGGVQAGSAAEVPLDGGAMAVRPCESQGGKRPQAQGGKSPTHFPTITYAKQQTTERKGLWMNNKRKALALVLVLAFVLLTGCAVEKQEKTVEDFEEAVAQTGYTVYEDNTNYDAQGYRVNQAVVALSQDEENRVEFFQCEDEEAAGELYEYYGAEIAAACAEAEESEEKDFTGDNYQCHGAQCDQRYFYRVQVEKTVLWAKGNKQGREVITDLVLGLGY